VLGVHGVTGTASATVGVTASGVGEFEEVEAEEFIGTGVAYVGVTTSASGVHGVQGTGTATILELAPAGSAAHGTKGGSIPPLGWDDDWGFVWGGRAGVDLKPQPQGQGNRGATGTGSVQILPTASGVGWVPYYTVEAAGFPITMEANGVGTHDIAGTATATLELTASGEGVHVSAGTGAITLALVAEGTGVHAAQGLAEATLALTAEASGQHGSTAVAEAIILLTAAGVGEFEEPEVTEVTGTGSIELSLTAQGIGEYTEPETGIIEPGGGGGWYVFQHGPLVPVLWKSKPKPVIGVGKAILGLEANGRGEHHTEVTGVGRAVIMLEAHGVGEHTDTTAHNNAFIMMMAA
jgi:hypothetical protein